METHQPKQILAKVILLGDSKAGKSSLFYRIKHRQFRGSSRGTDTMTDGPTFPMNQLTQTRGYDSCSRSILATPEIQVNLTIMDSVHSNVRGQSLSAHFYRRIQAVILICSLDNEHSLHRLTHWIHEAQVYIKDPKPVFIIAGTKSDIDDTKREISTEALYNFGSFHNDIPVFEVSAKTGHGVTNMLKSLAERLADQRIRSGRVSNPSNRQSRHQLSEREPLVGGDDTNEQQWSSAHGYVDPKDVDDRCCACVIL
ncbi:PREDICTED: ras-related protein RABF2a-like [Amphimedon queenslandica]|uniref:Uncharacterized protein n=1 Tax=Amphimedon queenslandica TaxID=400682 RepID=A0A1X7VM56_AMPQE|nr:PREDICTED: ras-related protein RABF2a-like [Amphimedon queenslandica]|eukprot:XP_011409672.1 PREDICTED: ras-related protein RABF2a-like [Amphimedon queenslandica]